MTATRTAIAVIAELIDDLHAHPAAAECREALACLADADLSEAPNTGLVALQATKPLPQRALAASLLVARLRSDATDPLHIAHLALAEVTLLYASVLLVLPVQEYQ